LQIWPWKTSRKNWRSRGRLKGAVKGAKSTRNQKIDITNITIEALDTTIHTTMRMATGPSGTGTQGTMKSRKVGTDIRVGIIDLVKMKKTRAPRIKYSTLAQHSAN
jgi:hypothetical protein